jgi:hypothetical protein
MRRSPFVILATIWLVPVSVGAQPLLGLAFKGGPNAATLTREYRVNRYGFTGGVAGYLQWPLASRFSLAGQMDLLYTPRGAKGVFEGEYFGRFRQRYWDVIIAARPEMQFDPAEVYLLLGAGLNVLLSANQEDASGMKVENNLSRLDVSLLVGAGIALNLPRQNLGPFRLDTVFLEARHDRGFTDTDPADGDSKNRNTSLMLGVSFVVGAGADVQLAAAASTK